MAKDAVFHAPNWSNVEQGIAGQISGMREMVLNNPDFHISIDDSMIDGDKICLRGSYCCNNPTTGAKETQAVLEIQRVIDGKLAEFWSLFAPGQW